METAPSVRNSKEASTGALEAIPTVVSADTWINGTRSTMVRMRGHHGALANGSGALCALAWRCLGRTRVEPALEQIIPAETHSDRNRDGNLSLDELRHALAAEGASDGTQLRRTSSLNDQLAATMASTDLNGDERINHLEFSQLIQRLQRLRQGEERLLLYLMPVDTNGNDRLDPEELDRLLTSIGQPALTSKEQALVFMNQEQSLSWHGFVDRLLLS